MKKKKHIQYVENKIEDYYQTNKKIAFPIFFFDDELGNRHYDFEEMSDELENCIYNGIGKKVLITISELDDDLDKDDMDINDLTFTPTKEEE